MALEHGEWKLHGSCISFLQARQLRSGRMRLSLTASSGLSFQHGDDFWGLLKTVSMREVWRDMKQKLSMLCLVCLLVGRLGDTVRGAK